MAVTCRTHRKPAGWKCVSCNSPLCPDCVGIQRTMHVELTTCMLCRQPANPLTRHRSDEASYLDRLPMAVAFPVLGDRWISLVAVTLFVAVFGFVGGLGRNLATLGLYATSYAIIRMTAAGHDEFYVEASGLYDLLWPVLKSGVIYVMLLLIAVFWVMFVRPGGTPVSYLFDPVLWMLAVTGFIWGPMSTLMAACHSSVFQILNPFIAFTYIARLGSNYWLALFAILVVGVFGGAAELGSRAIAILPIPFLPTLVAAVIEVYTAFVSARMLGLLLHVHGDRVGYGVASDYQTPLLGLTRPRGIVPDRGAPATAVPVAADAAATAASATAAAAAPVVDRYAPIELADEPAHAAPIGLVAREYQPSAARELDADALPTAHDYFQTLVTDAAKRGDWASALEAWKATPEKASLALSVDHQLGIGRTAASSGDDASARELFEAAAQGNAAELPRARAKVFLGRLLQERFGDAAAAQVLFKEVSEASPDSDAGKFAKKALGA